MHARTHTHTRTRTHTRKHTRRNVCKQKVFQGRFERIDRGSMTYRNSEFVADSWNLIREIALNSALVRKDGTVNTRVITNWGESCCLMRSRF